MTHPSDQRLHDYFQARALKPKRAPKWLDVNALGALRWSDDTPLEEQSRGELLTLLMQEALGESEATLLELIDALHDEDRIRWSEGIEQAWIDAGAKPAYKWAMFQLQPMRATDRILERASQLIDMAASGAHARAGWYLDVLERYDDVRAQGWLFAVAAYGAYETKLQQAAQDAHLRYIKDDPQGREHYRSQINLYLLEEHAESSIARIDLDPNVTPLDTGERTWLVSFVDDGFRLGVRDVKTRQLHEELPEPLPSEDPATHEEARLALERYRQQVDPFVAQWQETFETAMISARPYTFAYLSERFLGDRLMSRLIETLVWRTEGGELVRLSEGACFDHDYEDVALTPETRLHLVHPLEMTDESREAWGIHLAEAEIFQLFPQLARPTYAYPEVKLESLKVSLRPVYSTFVQTTLAKFGWRHGASHGGTYDASYLTLPGRNARLWIMHGPLSFNAGSSSYYQSYANVGINLSWLETLTGARIKEDRADPIVFSEAYTLIDRLREALSPE